MDITADFFTLFQLPKGFRLDLVLLEQRFRQLQTEVHPDRFASADDQQKRLSLQWATRANEAYQTLRKPLERARYLLVLAGKDIQAESNTAMAADFLMEQMQWRESVMEARAARAVATLEELLEKLSRDIDAAQEALAVSLDDEEDVEKAAEQLRRLMFLEKLAVDLNDALAFCDEPEKLDN